MGQVIWSVTLTFTLGAFLAGAYFFAFKIPLRVDLVLAGGVIGVGLHVFFGALYRYLKGKD